jgi:uncharacterized membrane protein (DUF4010 family)
VLGHQTIAVALAIATAAALAYKEPLHGWITRLSGDEIRAGLRLLIATFIILPILPDRTFDPWKALNPYKMWWLVILISGLSFLGYIVSKWLGSGRGSAVTGLVGGLVSSTAVTLTFAKRSKEASAGESINDFVAAVLLAWSVMAVRLFVLAAVLHPPLLAPLGIPLGAITAASVGCACVSLLRAAKHKKKKSEESLALRNPFSLTSAIKFAMVFAVVLLVVKIVGEYTGEKGTYGVAALAGLTDTDAITLSMAQHAREGGSLSVASLAIVIAALSNTIAKCALIAGLGAAPMRNRVVIATIVICAAGAVGVVAQRLVLGGV